MTNIRRKPDWHRMKFGKEYLSPKYYNKILKKYSTNDNTREDVDILADFVRSCPGNANILELGCGSGRATQIIAKFAKYKKFVVTDLSKQMLNFVKKKQIAKISNYKNIDHIQFLLKTKERFDIVVSLWSLAHSIFPWYKQYGVSAFNLIESAFTKFFIKNLNKNGRVFIIQTDGAGEEQILVKKSWFLGNKLLQKNNNLETEYYKDFQSPAIRILNSVFNKLVNLGVLDKDQTKSVRISGNEIEYESVDEALEIFMNFHLEGNFNGTECFDVVFNFLKNEFEKIITTKNKLAIGTGFWVYKAKKIG